MKHKHAELIKKWADGAKIQMKFSENDDWEDVNPTWSEQLEYRIKPEYNQSKGTRMNDLFKPRQCPRCFGLFNVESMVWDDGGTIYHLMCWFDKTKEQNTRGQE